ncbi:hypothetical protein MDA_GLEAN10014510 [Myotis davidii]|uniref:Uncharacterized protein n=1 Tax=Myotis davidii TaxID=225400 RepID=L5MG68_MYODS|nr:hypothetical protein MDA_GLEAN10014510 [Myotis davidii]
MAPPIMQSEAPDHPINRAAPNSYLGDNPTSPQSSGSTSPRYDASTPYGGPSHDANDGSSSSWDDASGTCFWNEAFYGRAHANDAWAPNDETSRPSHDGAHLARNDSTRQIRRKGSLFVSGFCYLFYFTGDQDAYDFGCFLTADTEDSLPLPKRE